MTKRTSLMHPGISLYNVHRNVRSSDKLFLRKERKYILITMAVFVGDSLFKYLDVRDGCVRSLSGAGTEDIRQMLADADTFETMRSVLDICVCNPVTDKFTTFEIILKTSDPAFTLGCSKTRRRYNDFVWLKKLLKSHHPLCNPAELPEKKKSSERFEQQFLVRRMKELEDWLYRVVDESLYFSDTSFHLFLQTNLSCKQIEAYLKGSLPEALLQQAYRDCDFKEEQSSFVSYVTEAHPTPAEPKQEEPAMAIPVTHRLNNDTQERADSGLSITEPDSDLDSSSYESQNSLSNSIDSVLTVYPPVTQVTFDSPRKQKTSSSGHVTCTGSDVTLKAEESLEGLSLLEGQSVKGDIDNSRANTDQTSSLGNHRVENGVLFSINS